MVEDMEEEYCEIFLKGRNTGEVIQGLLHGAYNIWYCTTLVRKCHYHNDGKLVQKEPDGRFFVECESQGLKKKIKLSN